MTKIGYTSNDLLNLAKYATGAGVNHYDLNLGTGVAGYVIFDGAVKGSKWLMDNKTNFKEQGFLKTLKNSVKAADDLQQSLKGGNLLQTAKNFSKNNTLRVTQGIISVKTNKTILKTIYFKGTQQGIHESRSIFMQ